MILVDTSVWVDHLRSRVAQLEGLLASGDVLMHPMIVGELACGAMSDRDRQLRLWRCLPMLTEQPHRRVLNIIESKRFMGRGIGFIDAHLLCAALDRKCASLWTRDKRLHRIAEEVGVAFSENVRGDG